MRSLSRARWVAAGHPWAIVLAIAAVPFTMWAVGTRNQDHHVRVAFPAAVNVVAGLDVQVDGFDVGKISKVSLEDGQAIVELGIDDERFWPLRQGTRATLRWPSPAGSGTRKVELDPAPAPAKEIGEGGIISGDDARAPVEIDEVFSTFDQQTRTHLRDALKNTSLTLGPRTKEVRKALGEFDEAVEGYRDISSDLSADTAALKTLVGSGGRLSTTLAARDAQISELIGVAATTLETFAVNSTNVQRTIERAPGTIADARGTLARVDGSVDKLDDLVTRLRPGAGKLASFATAARPALAQLRPTARMGAQVARTLRQAAPPLTTTLRTATPMFDDIRSILTDATPMVECLRPYTPEAAGVLVNWNSWVKNYLPVQTQAARINPSSQSHYARVLVVASPTTLHAYPQDTPSTSQLLLGKKYAMPRPPGLGSEKPFFLPQCGVTEDSLDASKDPEDRK